MERIWHDIEQNTDEWLELRCGKITASGYNTLTGKASNKGYKDLIDTIAEEICTGTISDRVKFGGNKWTERGHELESEAANYFEELYFTELRPGGFYQYGDLLGCSPDRLIGNDGLLEIKCPAFHTHREYLEDGILPCIYEAQCYFQLYVSGRDYLYFMSYHPYLKPLIIKVLPNNDMFEVITGYITTAEIAINNQVQINNKYLNK